MLRVVSFCALCAAPVYGPRACQTAPGGYAVPGPDVRFACECRYALLAKVAAEAALAQAQADRLRAEVPEPAGG